MRPVVSITTCWRVSTKRPVYSQTAANQSLYYHVSLFTVACLTIFIAACSTDVQKRAYEFGLNLGLAFQLTDDLLDYTSDSQELGKPTANDLRLGLATAPVLFAAQEHPELNSLIDRKFSKSGDAEQAYDIVIGSKALDQTRELVTKHCQIAADLVRHWMVDCMIFVFPGKQSQLHWFRI